MTIPTSYTWNKSLTLLNADRMLQTVSIIIKGKVQGVFYRHSAREKAQRLGITGYVENLPDGSVHITATGTDEQIEQLLAWCRQGPPKAEVSSVDTQPVAHQTFYGFTIRRG